MQSWIILEITGKGPYADRILIPQGSSRSTGSTFWYEMKAHILKFQLQIYYT